MSYRSFYERHYARLTGYGLWLRGEELNRVEADAAARAELRVLFARLSTYADTANSFTHPLLYALATEVAGVYPDWAFLPPPKDGALLTKEGVPWLLGTQSKRGPEGFDLIGFSNSIAQELINLPTMLARSGIPWSKAERLARPELPLLLLGGANASFTGLLQGARPEETLVDGIFLGEDPDQIVRLLELCREARRRGASKRERLDELQALPGFFEPDRPRATRKSYWRLDALGPRLARMPVPYGETPLGHWPLSEGCPAFCTFCAESWVRKPYRENRRAGWLDHALAYKAATGIEGLELYSFNFNMHSELFGVMEDAVDAFRVLSLKSQRFDWLARTPELPALLHLLGKTSMTCGLEGISPRLRRFLGKSLDEEDLWRGLSSLCSVPLRELKIFLIATGREEEADYQAFAEFLRRLENLLARHGQRPRVILSVTPLVRFPWTPLEFDPAPPPAALEAVARRVENVGRHQGYEVRRAADIPEYVVSQALLRADRPEILRALLAAVRQSGFVYYREVSAAFLKAFEAALSAEGLSTAGLLAGFDLAASQTKPWAAHETGVRRTFLWEQYQKAIQFEEDAYCLGRPGRRAVCLDCGACPDPESRRRLTHARQEAPLAAASLERRLARVRQDLFRVELAVTAAEPARGAPRRLLGARLASALMRADPTLAPAYRGCVGSRLAPDLDYCWVAGREVLTLEWRGTVREALLARLREPAFVERVDRLLQPWGRFHGEAVSGQTVQRYIFTSAYGCEASEWLRRQGLKATARRAAPGRMVWELSKESLKKRLVTGFEVEESGEGAEARVRVRVNPGPKFQPEDFARTAFRLPAPESWVEIRIEADGE